MTVDTFDPRDLIEAKKRGRSVPDGIAPLIDGLLAGTIEEAQVAAYLMAGVLNGFSEDEAVAMTGALVASGKTVDLSGLQGPTVDKHSTGGVGDTTTLVVAPLAAACGLQVAKLSGRGLGHTGGTLDKLESIPGLTVDLDPSRFISQVREVGLAVAAATADLVPGDKQLYALRDRTATVDSPALIAASVMSKKVAGGSEHIVLDVKTGDGAFMTAVEDAVALADLCVRIGAAHGRRVAALVTDMSQPLGQAIGNALEVAEAVEVLARPPGEDRLGRLCLEVVAALLQLARGDDQLSATEQVTEAWASGRALDRFRAFVGAQGGDERVADAPWDVLPGAPVIETWRPGSGTVSRIACRGLGDLANRLGAGRTAAGGAVDHAVGLEVLVSVGEQLADQTVAVRVHARSDADAEAALARLPELITSTDGSVASPPLVHDRIGF